jgi:hypothetical protein
MYMGKLKIDSDRLLVATKDNTRIPLECARVTGITTW